MFVFTNSKEKTSPTIIGAGASIVGDVKGNNIVQIHGTVNGKVLGDTVVIGRGGRVIGKLVAKTLFLHGFIDGPATVDVANIFSEAEMTGVLSYKKLNITNNNKLECKLVCRKGGACDEQ
ncbi:MAG: polymer-forming cytoskeletal protein [Alphaproteobacteria bacterium]|nr:polymer-forming cytoskeletal protein [Alphaproteobacteria bacterium]